MPEGVILFDIGGGSSECVLLGRPLPTNGGPPAPEIRAWASLPVGVVTLAERMAASPSTAPCSRRDCEVGDFVDRFAALHGDRPAGIHLLGTSGT